MDNGKKRQGKTKPNSEGQKPWVAFCRSSSLRLCYVLLNSVISVYECEMLLIISKNQAEKAELYRLKDWLCIQINNSLNPQPANYLYRVLGKAP